MEQVYIFILFFLVVFILVAGIFITNSSGARTKQAQFVHDIDKENDTVIDIEGAVIETTENEAMPLTVENITSTSYNSPWKEENILPYGLSEKRNYEISSFPKYAAINSYDKLRKITIIPHDKLQFFKIVGFSGDVNSKNETKIFELKFNYPQINHDNKQICNGTFLINDICKVQKPKLLSLNKIQIISTQNENTYLVNLNNSSKLYKIKCVDTLRTIGFNTSHGNPKITVKVSVK